jgi:hypothetical protein
MTKVCWLVTNSSSMGVQQSCDVTEAGKLLSGAVKRSNFDRRNCAIQSTCFNPSKQTGKLYEPCTSVFRNSPFCSQCICVFCIIFIIYQLVSMMGWWSFVMDTNWFLKYSDKCSAAELRSVYCISGSLLSHTISHLTIIRFSQCSIKNFPFHTQQSKCWMGILCNNTWPR